jgi:tRNA(Arg) A34 adenosine deaminase TadA
MVQGNPEFMKQAIALATENVTSGRGGPFGAVIVKDGVVVATGVNTVTATNDPTGHAEVNAIRAACAKLGNFELKGCEVYTSCEPCPMCLAAIYWARIPTAFYGNTREDAAKIGFDDELLYRQVALPIAERTLAMKPLLNAEANVAFQEWAAKADKVAY